MEMLPERALDEIRRLQECIDALTSVQALAITWSGMNARQIVNTLLDMLILVLHLDFAGAIVRADNGGPRLEAVQLPQETVLGAHSRKLPELAEWIRGDMPGKPARVPNPIGSGEVTVAPCRLGYRTEIGLILAASARTDFPTDVEMALLTATANQAVVGLQEARVLKPAEDRLRRSEAQLAEGQRLSHTGSWGWNVSSGELVFSQETFHILGFDPDKPAPSFDEAMGRLHPDDRALIDQILERATRDEKNYEFDARIVLPDKLIRHIRFVGRPLTNQTGGMEFVGTVLDITDRKRVEESLLDARAQLAYVTRLTTMGELVASIAHEVTQPLTAAATDANAGRRWLSGSEPNIDEARAAFSRIAKEASRAGRVVTRIRAFVKKGRPATSILAVNQLIDEVLALMQREIRSADVSLRIELADTLWNTEGDAVQLQQVLVNLIINAIEAMSAEPDGSRDLLLSSQNRGSDQIVVGVRDSGVGIDPSTVEDLFHPFVTTKANGMGMGLSISRSIVEAHGGVLWAENNVDKGATFWFALPAVLRPKIRS